MTAKELMDQLANDPDYQRRMKEKEERLKPIWDARKKDQEELVREINEIGYSIESVYDLVNNAPHPVLERKFIGPYPKAYPILLKHLNLPHEKIIREGIIRALTEKDAGREVEEALLDNFQKEKDPDTKWVLANALSRIMPYHRRRKYPEIRKTLKPNKTEPDATGQRR
ncbi:hypothetical protein [Coraliomargarita parva]|uniref:hypothetical protein n=1 Tax=Coraliomargarita parva TaxID=3014050 RepID=UPI0022B3D78F|nr:hypothetical protein [Coraliomargarita parva]